MTAHTAVYYSPPSVLDLLGIDATLSDTERDIRAATRQLVDDLVRPHVAGWYADGRLPARELALRFGEAGLMGMHLEGYGCAGASAVEYGLACLELEAGDSGVRSLVSVQGSLAMYPIWKYGSEEQKDRWLPGMAAGELLGCFGLTEPDSGSDPASMTTRATPTAGGYRLDGVKMWITNGTIADVAVIWAKVADPEPGKDVVRGFVVPTDRPGFLAQEVPAKLSLRASTTAEIVLQGVELSEQDMLPDVKGLRGPLSCLTQARAGILFGALGAARDALATAIDYSKTRTQFGKPLASFQLTQAKLADMTTAWTGAYLMALHIGRCVDAGTAQPAAISMGKLNSTRTALQIARTARTILGANGITGDYPVMRHAANLETVLTYEGTAEIHQLVLGKALTGVDAFQ
ncbi:glutaryl-CoA dehydrogenase [Nakamurella sp. UYEF19]|uniref:acyl-CoA dehydrogenase family protein n=1 Tax=Nakamurella sp. UYEF19 TaxID=1756392 RepID=UPI003396EF77